MNWFIGGFGIVSAVIFLMTLAVFIAVFVLILKRWNKADPR